jgi:hypothetical protein
VRYIGLFFLPIFIVTVAIVISFVWGFDAFLVLGGSLLVVLTFEHFARGKQ